MVEPVSFLKDFLAEKINAESYSKEQRLRVELQGNSVGKAQVIEIMTRSVNGILRTKFPFSTFKVMSEQDLEALLFWKASDLSKFGLLNFKGDSDATQLERAADHFLELVGYVYPSRKNEYEVYFMSVFRAWGENPTLDWGTFMEVEKEIRNLAESRGLPVREPEIGWETAIMRREVKRNSDAQRAALRAPKEKPPKGPKAVTAGGWNSLIGKSTPEPRKRLVVRPEFKAAGICMRFHSDAGCKISKCRFTHACLCKGEHKEKDCPKREPLEMGKQELPRTEGGDK